MFWFIVTMILAVIGIAGVITAIAKRDDRDIRVPATGVAVIALVLAGIAGFSSSFTQVDANTIGIVTSFGQPVGTIGSGPHLLAPWDQVDTFSTRIQTSVRTASSTEGDQHTKDCVQVALKGGSAACPDVTVRYAIAEKDAQDLWKRFGSFDAVRDQLVRSATNDSARFVFGQYEPQQAISGETLRTITADFTKDITARLASAGVRVDSVSVGALNLDPQVQDRINRVLAAQADTQVAQQLVEKNKAQAAANAALAASLTEPVLCQEYIDAAKEIKPTVFNGCGSNSGTPVIVNGSNH